MNVDQFAIALGAVSTLVGATGLAIRHVRGGAVQDREDDKPDERRPVPRAELASMNDLEALAFRVSELTQDMREVRDRVSAGEAHHERHREDLAGVRDDVDELSRELLLAQVELNKTLAAYMAGSAPPAPRSRKR